MKKTAVAFAVLSVILSSCSPFTPAAATAAPAVEPPVRSAAGKPKTEPPAAEFLSRTEFNRFKQELIPAAVLNTTMAAQQAKTTQLAQRFDTLSGKINAEIVKAQKNAADLGKFKQLVAEQRRVAGEFKQQMIALREIVKDASLTSAKIAEIRCDEIWQKTMIVIASFMIAALALGGAMYIKLSRRINKF